ncbi:MAG: preprotein translocase subunit SecE [Pyrinomonas methylaliphatogenes]|nr:preprotein translocase subunit SecE [Pyrinomonas methylaliphatogenes]
MKREDQATGMSVGDEASLAPSSSRVESGQVARLSEDSEERKGRGARQESPGAGLFDRTWQFVHDVRGELRRVTWPTANEVKNITIITLITVIFFAAYLFLVDQLFTLLVTQLERAINWLLGGA